MTAKSTQKRKPMVGNLVKCKSFMYDKTETMMGSAQWADLLLPCMIIPFARVEKL